MTVVENRSGTPFVVEAFEDDQARYYASPPNSRTIVDTVGELNRPAQFVAILDTDCVELERLSGRFQQGGTLVIGGDGTSTFEPRLQQSGSDTNANASCEIAAENL